MPEAPTPQQTLKTMAANYTALMELQGKERKTMAQLIRVCVQRLQEPSLVAQKEGMQGLLDLANSLEGRDRG